MKPFLIYTALRIGLFLVSLFVIWGILAAFFDNTTGLAIWSIVAAAVISSLLSLKLLEGPRERFADRVEARAERATEAFKRARSREDAD